MQVKMSDSESEFMLSQVSKDINFNQMQSSGYGLDVVDGDVISLEAGPSGNFVFSNFEDVQNRTQTQRMLYDNVVIEDISSEEE